MENFKYIKNITEQEGTILIYKQIGNSIDNHGNIVYGINGSEFANEMQYLQAVCDKITIRINSIGGSVLDGYAIASSILNSKKPVHTVNDGLAASTAGWCLACGNTRSMMDYASFMAHGSSGGDDKEMLNFIDTTINTILSNRSGKSSEDIANMMKKETWLNANQTKEQGFVDNIISSGKKVKLPKNSSAEKLALIYNQLIKPNMDKINIVLGLKNEASEESAVSAIEALKTKNEALQTELDTLKADKAAKELADKTALENKAEALVNKAVADKKITEAEKAEYKALAISNISLVENMLSKLGGVSNQTATKVFDVKNVKTGNKTEDRSEWTIRDWENKDVKGLTEMKNTNIDQYTELYNAFYKKS